MDSDTSSRELTMLQIEISTVRNEEEKLERKVEESSQSTSISCTDCAPVTPLISRTFTDTLHKKLLEIFSIFPLERGGNRSDSIEGTTANGLKGSGRSTISMIGRKCYREGRKLEIAKMQNFPFSKITSLIRRVSSTQLGYGRYISRRKKQGKCEFMLT